MNKVVLILGFPASGKTTHSEAFEVQGYTRLNRDTKGGKIAGLVPHVTAALRRGENVVLDNLFPTISVRAPFIQAAKAEGAEVECIWMQTSIEDSNINALHRMYALKQKFFFTPEEAKKAKHTNIYPILVPFRYRKEFQKPTISEGFDKIEKIDFVRKPSAHTGKALILDYDDTVRRTTNPLKYPTKVSEIQAIPECSKILKKYRDDGYRLLGVSNQSGVAKGTLSIEDANTCFEHTNSLLGVEIDYRYCPHQSSPPKCWCRKPQSGIGVALIEEYKLDPALCIYIGDRTTDKTFAKRLGFTYFHSDDFFGLNGK